MPRAGQLHMARIESARGVEDGAGLGQFDFIARTNCGCAEINPARVSGQVQQSPVNAPQFHLQPAFHFFHVQRSADGQFAQRRPAPLKMQHRLFDLRRRHVAIQHGAEPGKVAEHAVGARNVQARLAGDGSGFQVRVQRKIEIAAHRGLQMSCLASRRVVLHLDERTQLQRAGLPVLHISQQHVHVCQLKRIVTAPGIVFYLPDGRVAHGDLPHLNLRRLRGFAGSRRFGFSRLFSRCLQRVPVAAAVRIFDQVDRGRHERDFGDAGFAAENAPKAVAGADFRRGDDRFLAFHLHLQAAHRDFSERMD